MKACVTPLPDVNSPSEVSGGAIKPFPSRLNSVPPRIANGLIPGVSSQAYQKDNKMWTKHLKAYSSVNKYLLSGRYRNIMDMNAGFGGFAAAIESPKSWVMNVVPTIAKMATLGAVYERGLIGIYHDWYGILLLNLVSGVSELVITNLLMCHNSMPGVKLSLLIQGHMILSMLAVFSPCTKTSKLL